MCDNWTTTKVYLSFLLCESNKCQWLLLVGCPNSTFHQMWNNNVEKRTNKGKFFMCVCLILYTVHWAHLYTQQLNVAFIDGKQSWKEYDRERHSSFSKQTMNRYFSLFFYFHNNNKSADIRKVSIASVSTYGIRWFAFESTTFILKSTPLRFYFTVKTWQFFFSRNAFEEFEYSYYIKVHIPIFLSYHLLFTLKSGEIIELKSLRLCFTTYLNESKFSLTLTSESLDRRNV